MCCTIKLAVALWKDVDSTPCLSVWNKFQTHKAAESDSSVEKEGKKEDYFVVNLITPEVVIAICIYLFP